MTASRVGADPHVVGPYLAAALGDPRWAPCLVTQLAGGRSNLTYRVDSAAGSVVLRRPPLGDIAQSAHDMLREFTVLSALADTAVPVPAALHFCADDAVLGRPFYVMERVEGYVCAGEWPHGWAPEPAQRRAISDGLVEVLATLHAVDPAEVGLSDFGRPDGYLTRQVARWRRQWTSIGVDGADGLDTLGEALGASVPTTARSAIVHGDYRLDNTVLDPDRPGRIAAVLDWEMSTLGDPVTDLGILLAYWSEAGDTGPRGQAAGLLGTTAAAGFRSRHEVAELYARESGADLDTLPWALAFAFFKLAVVCAGVVFRRQRGALGDAAVEDNLEACIVPLIDLGRATLADRRLY